MHPHSIIAGLALLLGANACYVECSDGSVYDVGLNDSPCQGSQVKVYAAPGYADIVFFDGGKHYQCADQEGFSLRRIKENVIGCDNGVQGTCCGTDRCS